MHDNVLCHALIAYSGIHPDSWTRAGVPHAKTDSFRLSNW